MVLLIMFAQNVSLHSWWQLNLQMYKHIGLGQGAEIENVKRLLILRTSQQKYSQQEISMYDYIHYHLMIDGAGHT